MKIKLTEPHEIKGIKRKAGSQIIVPKAFGERLIEEGVANRVIEETENRIRGLPENRGARRFEEHKRFGR